MFSFANMAQFPNQRLMNRFAALADAAGCERIGGFANPARDRSGGRPSNTHLKDWKRLERRIVAESPVPGCRTAHFTDRRDLSSRALSAPIPRRYARFWTKYPSRTACGDE